MQDRFARLVLGGAVLVWIINGVIRWWLGAPLGHDEARYAVDARDLLAGEPTQFIYSGLGMQLVAAPGVLLGASERALRFVPLLLGTGFLAAAYLFARRLCGPPVAAWTVAVLAGSRALTTHATELLSDIPSAGLLLLACAILVGDLTREDGPRWRLVAIGPVCAVAFYVRYGSVVPLTTLGGAFVLVCGSMLVRRWLPLGAALVLFALLLVPHALQAREATGSVTGVLAIASDMAQEPTGLTQFVRDPFVKYGLVIAPLMLLGVLAPPRNRVAFALQLAAVGQFAIMTIVSSPHARFVYFGTVILVVLGVDAVWRLVQHLSSRMRTVACIVALAAVVPMWALTFVRIPHHYSARVRAHCTSVTRVMWYGCEAPR